MKQTIRFLSLPAILLLSLVISGCTTIEHISALRSEQERFSNIARAESVSASDLFIRPEEGLQQKLINWNGNDKLNIQAHYQELITWNQEYSNIVTSLNALIKNSRAELKQDSLLAIAEPLKLFAEWREAYTGHMANAIAGTKHKYTALTTIARNAEALASDDSIKNALGPRDRAVLNAIPSIVRFEAVVIDIIRNPLFSQEKAILYINKIKKAEDSFQQIDSTAFPYYHESTRSIMLTTGYNIYNNAKFNRWILDCGSNPEIGNCRKHLNQSVTIDENTTSTFAKVLLEFFMHLEEARKTELVDVSTNREIKKNLEILTKLTQ